MSGNFNQSFSTRQALRRLKARLDAATCSGCCYPYGLCVCENPNAHGELGETCPDCGYEDCICWMYEPGDENEDDDFGEGDPNAISEWDDDDDGYDDLYDYHDDDDEEDFDCGFVEGMGCTMAGSEDCDFECPYHRMNYGW